MQNDNAKLKMKNLIKKTCRTQASRFSLPQAHKGHREGNLTAYGCDAPHSPSPLDRFA